MFLLLTAADGMTSVSAEPVDLTEMTTQAGQGEITKIQGGLPAPKGRLKFKSSGPVCMCAEGMSERDIERAMDKLNETKVSGSITDSTNNNQASGNK